MIPREKIAALAEAVQGIPVWGCLPGSTAADAGVRYGDIVLEVNGVRTINIDDYLTGRNLRSDGVALRLFRDGAEVSLFVQFRPRTVDASTEMLELMAEGRFISPAGPPSSEPKAKPS